MQVALSRLENLKTSKQGLVCPCQRISRWRCEPESKVWLAGGEFSGSRQAGRLSLEFISILLYCSTFRTIFCEL